MTLSVKEVSNADETTAYFDSLATKLHKTKDLTIGQGALPGAERLGRRAQGLQGPARRHHQAARAVRRAAGVARRCRDQRRRDDHVVLDGRLIRSCLRAGRMSRDLDDPEVVLRLATELAAERFGTRFVATYAIGSLAHGGFSNLVSDVDLALVVADPLVGDDAPVVAEITERVRSLGGLAERLSLFWSTPNVLTGAGLGWPASRASTGSTSRSHGRRLRGSFDLASIRLPVDPGSDRRGGAVRARRSSALPKRSTSCTTRTRSSPRAPATSPSGSCSRCDSCSPPTATRSAPTKRPSPGTSRAGTPVTSSSSGPRIGAHDRSRSSRPRALRRRRHRRRVRHLPLHAHRAHDELR